MKCGFTCGGDVCYRDKHFDHEHFYWDWYGSNPMNLGGRVFSNQGYHGYEGSWVFELKEWPKDVIKNIMAEWQNLTEGFREDFLDMVEEEGDDETRADLRRCSFSPGLQ